MTPEEYLFSKLLGYRIDENRIQQFDIVYNDPNSWTLYTISIVDKKMWAILNFTDINYRTISYTDYTDTNPSGYVYKINIEIYGTRSDPTCCISNPISEINCRSVSYPCITVRRQHNTTYIEDNNVAFAIVDNAITLLMSGCTNDKMDIAGRCIPKIYVYAFAAWQLLSILRR